MIKRYNANFEDKNGFPTKKTEPCCHAGETCVCDVKIYHFSRHVDHAMECCACDQRVHVNQFTIDRAKTAALVTLHCLHRDNPKEKWFHVETVMNALHKTNYYSSGCRSLSILRRWELVEMVKRGWYRITGKGRQFVEGKIAVRSKVGVYNGRQHGALHGPIVNVDIALTWQFTRKLIMRESYRLYG